MGRKVLTAKEKKETYGVRRNVCPKKEKKCGLQGRDPGGEDGFKRIAFTKERIREGWRFGLRTKGTRKPFQDRAKRE